MFEKVVVVDLRQHLIGRVSSTIAKQLLSGQRVVAVRAEEVEISGAYWRNQMKLDNKRNKKTNHNPEKGPFSLRSPADLVKRVIRGMLPHKTRRGKAAMNRLKVFEGIPHPYDRMKRVVVPDALRYLRLKPGQKFTSLGELASRNGWKHRELLKTLEEKRKVKSAAYYERKKEALALRKKAEQEADIPADVKATLEQFGY